MHRIVRLLPGGEVAAGIPAIRRLNAQGIVTADVALRTRGYFARGRHLVRVGKREAGSAVVERACRPSRDGMTRRTSRGSSREIRRHVIGHVSANRLRAVP